MYRTLCCCPWCPWTNLILNGLWLSKFFFLSIFSPVFPITYFHSISHILCYFFLCFLFSLCFPVVFSSFLLPSGEDENPLQSHDPDFALCHLLPSVSLCHLILFRFCLSIGTCTFTLAEYTMGTDHSCPWQGARVTPHLKTQLLNNKASWRSIIWSVPPSPYMVWRDFPKLLLCIEFCCHWAAWSTQRTRCGQDAENTSTSTINRQSWCLLCA